jgi:hypothetical protein
MRIPEFIVEAVQPDELQRKILSFYLLRNPIIAPRFLTIFLGRYPACSHVTAS